MESTLPFSVAANYFDKELRGIFGRFQTKHSYKLNYVLVSLPFQSIDLLTTAGSAIDIRDSKVTFSQIIQRDINYDRVSKMAREYLEESKGKVVFFPPLLVSLIGIENGSAKERYASAPKRFENDREFVQDWEDFFQIRLPLAAQNQPHQISDGNVERPFYNFGAQLKYNTSKVRLVVIDGQHRLEALRSIKKKDVAETIEIPICVVFPPDAVDGYPEDVTVDLRELFLTVNQEQQKVSGHFLTLLDDQRLSASTIRLWGNEWKRQISPSGYTPLQLLEWNQRQERLENQVTKPFTITTISIVADALKDHLFKQTGEEVNGLVSILNLMAFKTQLGADMEAIALDEICDNNYHSSQTDILEQQIQANVVASLDILFRVLSPYKAQEQKVQEAYDWLNKKIANQAKGYEGFKEDVLQHFRTIQDGIDAPSVKEAARDFDDVAKRNADGISKFFYYNVFQQALVRCWIEIAKKLTKYGISPPIAASALTAALDVGFIKYAQRILAYDNLYLRRTIFTGERVLVNDRSKTSWKNLLGVSLGSKVSSTHFIEVLTQSGQADENSMADIRQDLINYSHGCGRAYLEVFEEVIRKDLKANYFERDLSDEVIAKLKKLDRSEETPDREQFDNMIANEAETRKMKALEQLALNVGIDAKKLIGNT